MKTIKYLTILTVTILFIQCKQEVKFEKLIPYQEEESAYWGYINYSGNVVIEPSFKSLPGMFYEGYALISTTDESFDYINKKGEEYERNYVDASDFNEGIAFGVKSGEYPTLLNSKLEEVKVLEKVDILLSCAEEFICFKNTKGKWGFLNKEGEIVIKPTYDGAASFSEGLALIKIRKIDTVRGKRKEKELYGFIDKEGNEVIKPTSKLSNVRSFSEGLAAYSDGYEWGWGYIDQSGKKAIRAKKEWEAVGDFKNGVATVQINGLWGLMNKKGKIILSAKFEDPLTFRNGLAPVEKDDKIGFINKKGKWVIEPDYEDYMTEFYYRRAIVEEDNYYVFINKKGNRVNKKEFYNVGIVSNVPKDYVQSDFFDIQPILDTLITEIEAESINGMNTETSLTDIMTTYGLVNSDLPSSIYRRYLDVQDYDIDDEIHVNSTIYFNAGISREITKRVSYYYFYYNEVVGYKPNPNARVESVEFEITLEGRKEGKADKLARGFKELFEQNKFSYNKEASTAEKYILTSPDDKIKATITFEYSNVNVKVDL